MITLAIDTSTNRGSVAVLIDGELKMDEQFTSERSHSSSLFVVLEKVREIAPRVDRIVIGLGPGSYAGVRISIAAALGIQLTQGAELVGIPSVAALETDASRYIAIGDARRETFYWTDINEGACIEGPLLLTEAELRERLPANTLPVFVGESLAISPEAQIALPSAAILARLGAADRGIVARNDLEPIYLREPHITQPKRATIPLPPTL